MGGVLLHGVRGRSWALQLPSMCVVSIVCVSRRLKLYLRMGMLKRTRTT
jgi:hypothetical protein